MEERLIFERDPSEGCGRREGVAPVECDVPLVDAASLLPEGMVRGGIEGFPDVSEVDIVRHYTRLSQWNYGVDTGFYPLGSCTMKYNPKVNEDVAGIDGFASLHPYAPEGAVQGALELIYNLEGYLAEITGMEAITLQPAAGAQGELCGLLMIAEYFRGKGEKRGKVIIPDTAHGTNPASSRLGGFSVVSVKSGPDGTITPEAIREVMTEDVAALMVTNPNTLGLFESDIREIAEIVHSKGGFLYCDGANLNAIMGIMKLGDMGVDVVQLNLHKTFSTPHGGGGPGSGPVGVSKALEPYLPVPRVVKSSDKSKDKNDDREGESYSFDYDIEGTIGRLKAFYGNFGIMVRAYSYIRRMGALGLRKASEVAILNANYIKESLRDTYHLPFDTTCMHECVFTDKLQLEYGVTTMDIAKRLIDYGFHPPTIYFPLVVSGALMIEPTETETTHSINHFIDTMKSIAKEAREAPHLLKEAPTGTQIGRVDESRAARKPVLRWRAPAEEEKVKVKQEELF